jgi:hypothetical protein
MQNASNLEISVAEDGSKSSAACSAYQSFK